MAAERVLGASVHSVVVDGREDASDDDADCDAWAVDAGMAQRGGRVMVRDVLQRGWD